MSRLHEPDNEGFPYNVPIRETSRWKAGGKRAKLKRRSYRPSFLDLELRWLPTTFSVISTADCGAGSLHQAILDSNGATPGPNTIDFSISGSGVQTISLLSALPSISVPVRIDGTSQTGYAGVPLIDLDGTNARRRDNGLGPRGGSDGSSILAMVINKFGQNGISIESKGNLVQSSYIGTNASGTAALANGIDGVLIHNRRTANTIGGITSSAGTGAGNVISGSAGNGVEISGAASTSNQVPGNLIGTNAAGTAAIANGASGVLVESSAIR